ncbi:hypothetical protein DFH28DRAFT_943324 [Melampsora americana]|nr:hypothetical protein DFH28DRAFT_943324 [Melampsora americana]
MSFFFFLQVSFCAQLFPFIRISTQSKNPIRFLSFPFVFFCIFQFTFLFSSLQHFFWSRISFLLLIFLFILYIYIYNYSRLC